MAPPAVHLELGDEQQRAVDHGEGILVLRGSARSGKTTAALARWIRLVTDGADPARLLVLCRDATAARRARSRLLAALPTGAATLHVTSPWALAYDVLARAEPARGLSSLARRRAIISELTARLSADAVSRLSPAGLTSALIDEIADLAVAADPTKLDTALSAAAARGHGDRWEVVAGVLREYHAALDHADLVDPATLLERAASHLDPSQPRFDSVIVDDVSFGGCAWGTAASLLAPLAAAASDVLVTAGIEEPLPAFASSAPTVELRALPPLADRRAIACHHSALEGDAVARIVLDALADDHDPDDIVIVCRTSARARRVARALGRHGIPAAPTPADPASDPHVRGLLGMLRWAAGDAAGLDALLSSPLSGLSTDARHRLRRHPRPIDESYPDLALLLAVRDRVRVAAQSDVARVAHVAFVELAAHLVALPGPVVDPAAERSLDACVAFIDDLVDQVELDPALDLDTYLDQADTTGRDDAGGAFRERGRAQPSRGVVAVARPAELRDGSWPVVIACGVVEGELPRVSAGIRYFDRAFLDGPSVAAPAARRAEALAAERRLFGDLVARATSSFVAVAPTEPGVLMSRFLADWPCEQATLPHVDPLTLSALAPTTNGIALHPEGRLRLSASQLDTYAECPRRYLYEYPLRVRGDANVWAGFGTLVHDVLEAFIGPDADETDLSWERLVALAEAHWRDDIAEYRPQREELRRDLMDVLRRWWESEGQRIGLDLHVLKAEHSFSIEVAGHTVSGRIDRVDRADDGVGTRILDYKTSKQAKSQADTDSDLQLRMYHLAALRDEELAALGEPTQLRLLFLRDMKPRDQEIEPDHEAASVALLEAMADQILAEAFEPRAGDHCRRCEVRRLCPLWPEGREIGAPA